MNLRSPCTLSTPLHRLFPSPKSSNSLNFRRRTTSSELQTPVELTGRSGSHSQSVPTHKVTVRDRKRGLVHEFFVPEDQYILHTAESQNISLPFACRHGCCTSCAVRVKSGQIRQPEALGISAELKSKLSSSNFLRSSGSTRRPAVSTSRDQMIVGSEIDSSRARNTDASPGALRKMSSSAAAQRSSSVLSADHKRVASSRNSNIKNLESTLKGIEGLHFNSDERQHY